MFLAIKRCRNWIGATGIGLLVALLGPGVRADSFSNITLGEAGPSGLDLGIFVTGPTQINASNSKTDFNTSMGLANGASTNFSGGGKLTGTLYVDPGATVQSNLSSQFNVGGVVMQSLSQAVTDVQSAAANAAALTATSGQTYGNVGGSPLTINATGALNGLGGHDTVVDFNSISITNPSNDLTISGSANDFFIINVTGTISVSNGAIQALGVPNSHILFNVEGTGNSVSLSNGTSLLTGTYLAPDVGQKITISPGTVDGAIIGYQIQTSSGPTINGAPFVPAPALPSPAPLAGSAVLLTGLLIAKGMRNRVHA